VINVSSLKACLFSGLVFLMILTTIQPSLAQSRGPSWPECDDFRSCSVQDVQDVTAELILLGNEVACASCNAKSPQTLSAALKFRLEVNSASARYQFYAIYDLYLNGARKWPTGRRYAWAPWLAR
jgi:hypothetical protein